MEDNNSEHINLLKEWQERLGLHEWRIVLNDYCHPEDMEMPNCTGCTTWSEAIKTARIDILDEIHYGEKIVPYDWEKTLVHELLHLKLCLIASDTGDLLQERYMHQIIDDLARAFVDAKRNGK